MTDFPDYGLGAIPSPPDERDFHIDTLYAMAGLDKTAPPTLTLPPPTPSVMDQGNTGRCVAFSEALVKRWEDMRDTGDFVADTADFFFSIGGSDKMGAVIRNGLNMLVSSGYPEAVNRNAAEHKITAYYAIPLTQGDVMGAIANFGAIVFGTTWYHSWFTPVNGVLPNPDYAVGGHAIADVTGYDTDGFWLTNSWGPTWSLSGRVKVPWSFLRYFNEAWKLVDAHPTPPPTATYTLHVAPRAKVMVAQVAGSCISGWSATTWGPKGSTAPCKAPTVLRGCHSGSAPVAYVTKGSFKGRYVRIGTGVTVTQN